MKRIYALLFAALVIGLIYDQHSLRAQFMQQNTFGGTSTCSSNAQTINLGAGNLVSLSDLKGVTISWIVGSGCTNTGPSTLALTGGPGGCPCNIYRRNGGALIQLGGYEMPAGDLVRATYDGTQFELETDYVGSTIVGISNIIHYANADPGFLLDDGACESETAYPALYAKLGTTYNTADGCTGSNFGLPDLRGALPAGLDNMGGTAANRITSAVSDVAGTTLGAAGGSQGYASGIAQTYLKSFSLSVTNTLAQQFPDNLGAEAGSGTGLGGIWDGNSISGGLYGSISVSSGGSGTAFPTLPYVQIVQYEIRT